MLKKRKKINIENIDNEKTINQIKNDKKYLDLQKELLNEEKDLDNDYQMFLEERRNIIPLSKAERKKIEEIIKYKILQVFKQNKIWSNGKDDDKGYFKYEHFREIDEIREYFIIMMAIGDRNIGKSTSSQEEADKVVARGKRFMWLRNIDDEVEAQIQSDTKHDGWLSKRGWTYEGKLKAPSIVTRNKTLLGWYRPLNTSSKFKSINFPETELIIYEEFAEGNTKGKYHKFVKFASTVLRMNQGLAIMQANYVDQQDEMVQSLGLGSKELTYKDFVFFNWEVGAIIILIPKGIYRYTKDKTKDLAFRASLASFPVWKSQYGGGFSNEQPNNIINDKDFTSIEAKFNIYTGNAAVRADVRAYGAFKMTMYEVHDDNGNMHNVLTETLQKNDKPIFIFDELNKILYPHSNLIEVEALDNLIYEWNIGNLKTTSLEVHKRITVIFATALKAAKRENDFITSIENIVGN